VDAGFAALVESLAPKLDELLALLPLTYGRLPCDIPSSGVYLFSEDGRHLYVGRSNRVRARYRDHCRPGAAPGQAAFAFQLAGTTSSRRPEDSSHLQTASACFM